MWNIPGDGLGFRGSSAAVDIALTLSCLVHEYPVLPLRIPVRVEAEIMAGLSGNPEMSEVPCMEWESGTPEYFPHVQFSSKGLLKELSGD